jgi:Acetoacetate decarboxylase (ADC)
MRGGRRRLNRQENRKALVDGVPFTLPVSGTKIQALFTLFPCDFEEAKKLIPGNEIHPVRIGGKAVFVVSVVNYLETVIGKYIEYSIAIACTHTVRPVPGLWSLILMKPCETGQYVVDLPVSTEISVKGGKGIWGMPKHQANLNFLVTPELVSAQYDLDGQLAFYVEASNPGKPWLPMSTGAINYCGFRGMLMKSYIYFRGKVALTFKKKGSARVVIGDHPRVQCLKNLRIGSDPIATVFIPEAKGVLDDYFECWFLSGATDPPPCPEDFHSVIDLGLGQTWLAPPDPELVKQAEKVNS